MKKINIGILGVLLVSATLNADGRVESDMLIAGKDFPFPSGGDEEAQMPEDIPTPRENSSSNGWEQWGQRQSKIKSGGRTEKEYFPEVEDEDGY
jgi:hypothetical protein